MEAFAELFVSAQNLSQSCIAVQLAGGEDGEGTNWDSRPILFWVVTPTPVVPKYTVCFECTQNIQGRKFDVSTKEVFDGRILVGLMKEVCKLCKQQYLWSL